MILFILCILMLIWPSLGKYSFIFTSDQLTQEKAHALLAKVLRFETQSKTQSKWV